jgi:hypothetical protein
MTYWDYWWVFIGVKVWIKVWETLITQLPSDQWKKFPGLGTLDLKWHTE